MAIIDEEERIEDFSLRSCFIFTVGMFDSYPQGFVEEEQESIEETEADVVKMIQRMSDIWRNELQEPSTFQELLVEMECRELLKFCEKYKHVI
jgi:hypothetical protein